MAAWVWIPLTCTGCEKVTYRPPANTAPCGWCKGKLS